MHPPGTGIQVVRKVIRQFNRHELHPLPPVPRGAGNTHVRSKEVIALVKGADWLEASVGISCQWV